MIKLAKILSFPLVGILTIFGYLGAFDEEAITCKKCGWKHYEHCYHEC